MSDLILRAIGGQDPLKAPGAPDPIDPALAPILAKIMLDPFGMAFGLIKKARTRD